MTDEELDALVGQLAERPYRRGGESNDEMRARRQSERDKAAAAITTLRAQLAEANARADRAEAARAAAIRAAKVEAWKEAEGATGHGCRATIRALIEREGGE